MALEREPLVFPIARGSSSTYWFGGGLTALFLILPIIFVVVSFWPSSIGFRLSGAELTIEGSLYGREIPLASLKRAEARRLVASDEPGHEPVRRTNGVGLPGYSAGWFRLRNQETALLFATDWSRALIVPTTEEYALIITPEQPDAFLTALRGVNPDESATPPQVFPLARTSPPRGELLTMVGVTAVVPLLVAILLGVLIRASRKVRFELSRQGLRVRGDLYGRLIPRDALRVKEARIVNMKRDAEFRPILRTNGVGMPGYGSGWFRLKGWTKALLFVTDWAHAVAIPTSLGYTILVSPADPGAFLAALRET